MKVNIKNITTIHTGVFAQPAGFGEVTYMQSKYFDEQGNLDSQLFADLPLDSVSEKHILQSGDVLFAAKGNKNFATVYHESQGKAVASTSFFVIKITNPIILPEYLAWFLNHPNTMALLKSKAIGSSIPSISKKVLEHVELYVPTFEKQKLIIEISRKRNQEIQLKQRIQLLRDSLIDQQILNTIKLT